MQPCHRARQPSRRLRHAGRAREPSRGALAPDRAAGHSHPGSLSASGTAIFRLEGGPGITNMKFPNASRFVDQHDVVLVGGYAPVGDLAAGTSDNSEMSAD
jgi:hypothetical protein